MSFKKYGNPKDLFDEINGQNTWKYLIEKGYTEIIKKCNFRFKFPKNEREFEENIIEYIKHFDYTDMPVLKNSFKKNPKGKHRWLFQDACILLNKTFNIPQKEFDFHDISNKGFYSGLKYAREFGIYALIEKIHTKALHEAEKSYVQLKMKEHIPFDNVDNLFLWVNRFLEIYNKPCYNNSLHMTSFIFEKDVEELVFNHKQALDKLSEKLGSDLK